TTASRLTRRVMRRSAVSSTGVGRGSSGGASSAGSAARRELQEHHEADEEEQVDNGPREEEDAGQLSDDEVVEGQARVGGLVRDADADDAQVRERVAVNATVAQSLHDSEDGGEV